MKPKSFIASQLCALNFIFFYLDLQKFVIFISTFFKKSLIKTFFPIFNIDFAFKNSNFSQN